MRLTTVLLIATMMQVSASGFAQRISLSKTNRPLKEIIKDLRSQSGYDFVATDVLLTQANPVTIAVKNTNLKTVLDEIFSNQPITYTLEDNTVTLKARAKPSLLDQVSAVFANIDVEGQVLDTLGHPLVGATLFIENMGVVHRTNEKGHFKFSGVPEDAMILVNYVGYGMQKVKVSKNFMTIVMKQNALTLQAVEVVYNTGLQVVNKERATGSFSKPDMKTFANRSSSMDVVARLEGQIPGMVITPLNSLNGTVNSTITGTSTQKAVVRGQSSISLPSQPLQVVDGIIVTDFGGINVDNIADITVLKDAAAAAIWGAQAANGVIVVTTKTGARNQKLSISYSGFASFNGKPNFDYARNHFLSSSQYIDLAKQLFDPVRNPYSNFNTINNSSPIFPSQQILYDQYRGLITATSANQQLDSLAAIDNTDQVKNVLYRNAYATNHTVSLSGGTNAYTVFSSVGYGNTQSSSLGVNTQSYKVALNQSFRPNDRFSFSLNAQLANNISTSGNPPNVSGDILPYQLFKDANGNDINTSFLSGYTPEIIKQYSALSAIDLNTYRILDEAKYYSGKRSATAVNLIGNASVRIWQNLKFLGTYGYSTTPIEGTNAQDSKSIDYRKFLLNNTVAGSPPTYLVPATGQKFQTNNNNQGSWTLRNQLTYNLSTGKHAVSFQGGQEARTLVIRQNQTVVYGYNPQLLTYTPLDYATLGKGVSSTITGNSGFPSSPFTRSETETRYLSYFALGSYTYDRKYTLDGSWRVDHSNLFGSDVSAQNKPAYSIGGKWALKEESFLAPVKWLDALALRLTYGITGNSPYVGQASTYDILRPEPIPNSSYAVIAGPALQLSGPATKTLSWEATRTTNLGLDFSVFKNRLSGSIEYYHKSTTDLIGSYAVNYFTGFTTATTNIGNLVNNGLNINLNSINISTRNFSWQSGFVLGHNINKLVSYQAPSANDNNASLRLGGSSPAVGYDVSALFAYRYAGLDNIGDPQIYLANGDKTKTPNVATAADLVYMGNVNPKFNGGLSNSFRYKQFELSANLYYSLGGLTRNVMNTFWAGKLPASGLSGNVNVDFLKRWQNPGDEANTNIPRYLPVEVNTRSTGYYRQGDINVISASYVKLSDAAFIYNLDPTALRWLKISGASFRAQVNNVLLWTANKNGIDPEFQSSLGAMIIPIGRNTFSLGLNVNF